MTDEENPQSVKTKILWGNLQAWSAFVSAIASVLMVVIIFLQLQILKSNAIKPDNINPITIQMTCIRDTVLQLDTILQP